MSNESLPRDVKKNKMVKKNDFHQRLMIDDVQLLSVWFLLPNLCYFINISKQEIWEIHHLDPGEVCEESNMVSIQLGKSAFTSEVLHDDFHHGSIVIKKVTKRQESISLISVSRLQVWLIILII